MKGGCCSAGPPVLCWPPRLCVSVPRLVCSVAVLNGGVVCVVVSRVQVGSSPSCCSRLSRIVLLLFAFVLPFSVFTITALLVRVVCLWQGCVIVGWRCGVCCPHTATWWCVFQCGGMAVV